MPNFHSQSITTELFAQQTITTVLISQTSLVSPSTDVGSHIFVPHHIHTHSHLEGLFHDDHPQYLTDARAVDLMTSLITQQPNTTQGDNKGGGLGVFLQKKDETLEFKTIIAGSNISIVEDTVNNTLTVIGTVSSDTDGGTY